MDSRDPTCQGGWDEQISQKFLDCGRYFVPERESQLQIIVDLVPCPDRPGTIFELCCGEGLLAQALLERFPACTVCGFDGSTTMLRRAQERLARFGERFQPKPFDLASRSWRAVDRPVHAVVTSLAVHHLERPQKQVLFRDVHRMLAPGGVFVVADLVEPAHPLGREVAAKAWDEAVRERALELDGTTDGFDFFQRERWNSYRYFDPEDIDKPSRLLDQLKWLEQAGFVDVDIYWMRAGHVIFGGWKPGSVTAWRDHQAGDSAESFDHRAEAARGRPGAFTGMPCSREFGIGSGAWPWPWRFTSPQTIGHFFAGRLNWPWRRSGMGTSPSAP